MKYLLTSIFLFFSSHLFAFWSSADSVRIYLESENYRIIHQYNWSSSTHEKRWDMINNNQDPFTKDNDYAYMLITNKASGDTVFKMPCGAYTKLLLTKDEKYIVCLSTISTTNPHQIVVMSIKGDIIYKKGFTLYYIALEKADLDTFKAKFPDEFKRYDSLNRIVKCDGLYNIDNFNVYKISDNALEYLRAKNIQKQTTDCNPTFWAHHGHYENFNKVNPVIDLKIKWRKLIYIEILFENGDTVKFSN